MRTASLLLAMLVLLPAMPVQAGHVKDANKPCQKVQVKRKRGWSPPMLRREARARGHEVKVRYVPLASTAIYTSKDVPWIIKCLSRLWDAVQEAKARAVAWCESRFHPQAVSASGTYKGVFQQEEDLHGSEAREANLMWANPNPRKVKASVFNAWANTFTALRRVAREGWRRWECA